MSHFDVKGNQQVNRKHKLICAAAKLFLHPSGSDYRPVIPGQAGLRESVKTPHCNLILLNQQLTATRLATV